MDGDVLKRARAKKRELDKLLRKADQLGRPGRTERERDAERKRDVREATRLVEIPPCADPARRLELEADDYAWLMYYCGDLFWYDFTLQQRAMIEAIGNAIRYGGDQAIAASRGEGKTKIFERMLLKHTLSGAILCSVLFGATASHALDSLQAIRDVCEGRGEERDGVPPGQRLLEDYPEVCVPVRALEDVPSRAHYMRVSGTRIDTGQPYENESCKFRWCGHEIVFPGVPGSPSSRAIIATRGLDGAVRGLNKLGRRPQLAGIDDPETEDSATSEEQAAKLEKRIDRAIAGLGGQQKSIARVMLTTLQNRICASYRFTDPTQKPTWKGRRFRFLIKRPDRQDLWEEYVARRAADLQKVDADGNHLDGFARGSHGFYLQRRESMDAGAEVANPHRFNGQLLPDGTQLEVSALQRYYNEVSRIGAEAVACELDNDPPEESGPIESGITAHRVQCQVSGYPRRIVPPGCTTLDHAVDVGKWVCHWVVKAFRADATAYVIDYGVLEVHGTVKGTDEGLDKAIIRALQVRRDEITRYPYTTADGKVVQIDKSLVDARYRTDAVCTFCREAGLAWQPAMGYGRSDGCIQANFNPPARRSKDKRPGDGWFLKRRPKGGGWMLCMDTDRWKSWEHDRWLTPPTDPGTCLLFGQRGKGDRLSEDQKGHFSFSKHITNEVEREVPTKNKGMAREWYTKSHTHHWLDASYMADVAANMMGISLLGSKSPAAVAPEGWFAAQKKGK